jgi:hypothetical protein
MAVTIKQLGVEVPGKVVRLYDGGSTTLMLDEEQTRTLYDQLGPVVEFFNGQTDG